jgi:hypothetical protein
VSTARIAVVRDRIAVDAHAFVTALDKVFRSTASPTLGPHLLGDVDLVNTDVNALAPTASVSDDGLVIPSAAEVSADRQAFDPAVLVLETAGRAELDILLKTRESEYRRQRLNVLVLIAGGAAVALPSAWWLLRRRAGRVRTGQEEPEGREPRPSARLGRRSPPRERSMERKKGRETGPDHGTVSARTAVPGSALDGSRRDPVALPTRRPAGGTARVGHGIGRSATDAAPPDPAYGPIPEQGDR